MRSRYSAYVYQLAPYLLDTWHPDTRPATLDFDDDLHWAELNVLRTDTINASHGIVAFRARYKINGKSAWLRETSRFSKLDGRWHYVDALDPPI